MTGIVTGRGAQDARTTAGMPDLLVVGNHGLEWLEPGAGEPIPAPGLEWISAALDGLMAEARDALGDPGVTLDHKGLSGTIHYRMAADPEPPAPRCLPPLPRRRIRESTCARAG